MVQDQHGADEVKDVVLEGDIVCMVGRGRNKEEGGEDTQRSQKPLAYTHDKLKDGQMITLSLSLSLFHAHSMYL